MNKRDLKTLAEVRAVLLDDGATGRASTSAGTSEPVSTWRPIIEVGILALLLAIGSQLAIQTRVVEGSSMEPTLRDGERVLIDRVAYIGHRAPRRGDVVVFRAWPRQLDPFDAALADSQDFIKRIVGVPGDVIEIRRGLVIVNGRTLDEAHLEHPAVGEEEPITVERGKYFLLGDNRENSSDSRLFGTLAEDRIVGRAWARYWPIENAGPIFRAHGEG